MEKLIIEGTESTPQVNFIPENGLLEIEGKLIPEDAGSFFVPIFTWLENFCPDKQQAISMRFSLFYYNTSSSKRIFDIMRRLDAKFLDGCNITIQWEYEEGDEDTQQDGEDFKSMLKLPFNICKV
ncbi:MAG: hypothetical protein A3F72_16350 [Bacteroidetes bacterium RIFCSPLOWO2_12_FULL_35_15]|nr:MAG: hypothetical protein A3F72_16350 [Bacteroidetes bacterium RIFCSPLOWO2_12_FULL_35_15]